ncbi:MAG: ATP-binding cassette domain-containing protein [Campylobacteraceae bacterium]
MFTCKELKVSFENKTLLDINFSIDGSLALVGQSGSGKSLTLKAVLDLLPKSFTCKKSFSADYEIINGKTISFVPQNPFTALSPMTKIKEQFFVDNENTKRCMELVELDISFLDRFPSELSGGQLQRVIIAIAISQNPKLLLLDEPTTALDSKTKEQIISLFEKLHFELKFDMLFVTHELGLAGRLCMDLAVLKDGKIVEFGKASEVFMHPKEEYTKVLLNSGFERRDFRV